MTVTIGSKSSPQTYINENDALKNEIMTLKVKLGYLAYANIMTWMTECSYCDQTKKGTKVTDSKKILKMSVMVDLKTKETRNFDFYADKFVSENIPEDYQDIIDDVVDTDTKAAIYNIFCKACCHFLETEEPIYADMIRKTENIDQTCKSAAIRIAACIVLTDAIVEKPERAHLLNPQNRHLWI